VNRIVEKRALADRVWLLRIEAPRIAKKRKAGQFIMVRSREGGERIPLTIADANPDDGTISLVIQVVGKSTSMLCSLEVGDSVLDLVGPLGKPTHIEKVGTVAMVGGGIGVAPLHPIAQALKQAGNRVISILGARNQSLLILREEMTRASDEIRIVTDDGSEGRKGLVTVELLNLIENGPKPDMVVAIGPAIMMKAVSELTRPYGIPTVVSLNPVMVDGTGMCGGCRILVDGKNQFACVDGPEFDGHLVDFDTMMARQRTYREYEQEAVAEWQEEGHKIGEEGCRLAPKAGANNE
jgi:ferredoxin--NADP+ reductase